VSAVAVGGGSLLVAGSFGHIAGQVRSGAAAIDTAGAATAWNPDLTGKGFSLAARGSTVYLGGSFAMLRGPVRKGLAAIDAAGRLTDWDPAPDGQVLALVYDAGALLVGGTFTTIGGQARSYLAALDPATGRATAYAPEVNGAVGYLAAVGDLLFATGDFTIAGGLPRLRSAAFDRTGAVTGWDPSLENFIVQGVAVVGSKVHAVGVVLTEVGGYYPGVATWLLAALSHSRDSFHQIEVANFGALVSSGSTLYASCTFPSAAGTQQPAGLVAIDPATGLLLWGRTVDGPSVRSLAVVGDTLYLGGDFAGIAGEPRLRLAALDAGTGATRPWSVELDGPADALAVGEGVLHIGGRLTRVGPEPHRGYARLTR
jgi:hypothetical protein